MTRSFLILSALLVSLAAQDARAAEPASVMTVCTEATLLERGDALTAWTVSAARKVHFASCPEAACNRRAYVVAGDTVLSVPGPRGWACGVFPSAAHAPTVGWLPVQEFVPAPPPRGWGGAWLKARAGFYLQEAAGRVTGRGKTWIANGLASEGGAPEVVVGLIELDGAPVGNRLEHRSNTCHLRLGRIGPYLVARGPGCVEGDSEGFYVLGYGL
ncbi:MAG: hypothetical protein Q8P18_15565 [Pseudomonadota bacterium]|nr:hypothetical protein [Pseudomonadota bacterium]